jgi:hypothetical protein
VDAIAKHFVDLRLAASVMAQRFERFGFHAALGIEQPVPGHDPCARRRRRISRSWTWPGRRPAGDP